MNIKVVNKNSNKKSREAMIHVPLASFRYLSTYPRDKKIIVEIDMKDIERVNSAETLDEVINEARLDYAMGNFTTHKNAKSLIAALDA